MTKQMYLYVFDSVSDWEYGYVMAELKSGRYFKRGEKPLHVITVGVSRDTITTMGGLRVKPDITVEEMNVSEQDLIVLPGGESWGHPIHDLMLKQVDNAFNQRAFIAAICGAVHGLAKAGYLEHFHHTSNDQSYLEMIYPAYRGNTLHQNGSVVRDGQLITASGVAPLEFARETIGAMDVFQPNTLEAWYQLNKTNDATYFYQLMSSLQTKEGSTI
ncbi:glutamine amidotransferase [Exiguobacterium sp. Leaf187]|uniref:type 1 glutamine amidotransferase family protein n=1 Tax=Exiguobacterium TaxID=33986 RepID=UPI0006FA6BE9|nr:MULTISPECIES: type 1 glutamine amidotransferase family protein [Exiguobacterium]KQS23503.1 glutamine amidotransferase [Exiguobacterium sp. Leaf187]